MRDVPASLTNAWRAGDFIGKNRAIGRVTVQKANIGLHHFNIWKGVNIYASLPFGMGGIPKELPNVKSISWSRDVDAEIADCTVELYNTQPLPIGETPRGRDFDLPGWYTPTRGAGTTRNRWGHEVNEWSKLLLPDNIIRTYEGYGFDPDVCPSKDSHLVQTGAWIIDEITMTSAGTISLKCRDFGRLLTDHIAMEPVIPESFYPLKFKAREKISGIRPPQALDLDTQDPGSGPNTPPSNVVVTPGNGKMTATWDPMPPVPVDQALPPELAEGTSYKTFSGKYYLRRPEGRWYRATGPGQVAGVKYLYGDWTGIPEADVGNVVGTVVDLFGGAGGIEQYTPRYENVGFRIRINGHLQGISLDETQTSVTIPRLLNGNVYFFEVGAVYQELNTGRRYTTDMSQNIFFSPRTSDAVRVDMFSIESDLEPDGTINDGFLRWGYIGDGREVTWKVTCFINQQRGQDEPGEFTRIEVNRVRTFELTETVANGPGVTGLDTDIKDLNVYNAVVWATWDGHVGPGGHMSRTGLWTEFWQGPVASVEPDPPPNAEGRAAYTGPSGETVEANPVEVALRFSGSSNTPYVGLNGGVHGHTGAHAFDDDINSYWLSVGNSRPDAPYAYEWIEGSCGTAAINAVGFRSAYKNMLCYVSLKTKEGWITHDPSNVIPYDPNHAASSPNGANIPFVTAKVVNPNGIKDVVRITLAQAYPGVERVRLTFYNLPNTGVGTYKYRAAINEVYAWGNASTPDAARTAPTPEGGEVTDARGVRIVPAGFIPGAGGTPGMYEDYTDIVKLLCAWGGLFWPENGRVYACDGTYTSFSFGPAPYNLGPNIDPVLGLGPHNKGGRVWGDFEVAGVAGVKDLTVDLFDKKPLMDGVSHVRDILGFLFYIDEEGSAVFRSPNIYTQGNWVLNRSGNAGRTPEMVVIDELQTLVDLTATLSSRNVREQVFIGTPDGKIAGTAKGMNPNPSGWRRVAGWTDQNFATKEECQVMADLITLRQLFTYRGDNLTIAGYPRIQINDQIRINERVTSESYIHYVKSINSELDMETGQWIYNLETHWLGERPYSAWAFDPKKDLLKVTQRYLQQVRGINLAGEPAAPPKRVPTTTTFPEYAVQDDPAWEPARRT